MPLTMTFEYAVRDRNGKLVKGTLEAESQAQVASRLSGMGFAPVSITRTNVGLNREVKIPGLGGRVKLKDLSVMSRQFATMINSGLSLLRALTILTDQTPSRPLAEVLGRVRADVETGSSLSAAMGRHPKAFPPLMVNMCRAGETGGFLDQVLLQVADNYEAEVKLRSKIKSAMTYPVVVLAIAILGLVAMLLFVVPVFTQVFASLGGELPAPTRMLVALSDAARWLAPILLALAVVGGFVWQRIKHIERVRAVVDPLKLKAPVFGGLFQKIAISRFARNLGALVHAGVPILQALDIVADTTGNYVIEQAIHDVQRSVSRGESLAGPLAHHDVFPQMVVQMLSVGEDTGALDSMLNKISEFYDQEVEATTDSLTALIEPVMIAVVGGLVGSMIIALYLPIFKVFDLVGA